MTHRIRLLWLGAALLAASAPAAPHAQDSLFDQGRGMLEGVLQGESGGDLSDAQIGDGLREALKVGTERVTASLGQVDGFNTNPDVHIPQPPSLQAVQSALDRAADPSAGPRQHGAAGARPTPVADAAPGRGARMLGN